MSLLQRLRDRSKFVDSSAYYDCESPKWNQYDYLTERISSRTYLIKQNPESRVSTERTLCNVDDSASSCENSLDETEVSTLRQNSFASGDYISTSELDNSEKRPPSPTDSDHDMELNFPPEIETESGSTVSIYSWEDVQTTNGCESMLIPQPCQQSEYRSIAQLDLHSNPEDQLEQLKCFNNGAYEKWLSAKRRNDFYKREALRERREQQDAQDALRKKVCQERVREWEEAKVEQQKLKPMEKKTNKVTKSKSPLDPEAEKRFREWELRKIQEAEERRQSQQRQLQLKQLSKEKRKAQSAAAWEHWMKGVAQRPKPVPLNQGFATLRGTISAIYMNPNKWMDVN